MMTGIIGAYFGPWINWPDSQKPNGERKSLSVLVEEELKTWLKEADEVLRPKSKTLEDVCRQIHQEHLDKMIEQVLFPWGISHDLELSLFLHSVKGISESPRWYDKPRTYNYIAGCDPYSDSHALLTSIGIETPYKLIKNLKNLGILFYKQNMKTINEKIETISRFSGIRYTGKDSKWEWIMDACKKFDILNQAKKFTKKQETEYKMFCDGLDSQVTLYDWDKIMEALCQCVEWYNTRGTRSADFEITVVRMNEEAFHNGDAVQHIGDKFGCNIKRLCVTQDGSGQQRIFFEDYGGNVLDLMNYKHY